MIESFIQVRFEWVGYHHWPGAHGRHAYLSHLHRHKFYARVAIEVEHNDRELEFFEVLDHLEGVSVNTIKRMPKSSSCEDMASVILEGLLDKYGSWRRMTVRVLEDGENGACLAYVPDQLSSPDVLHKEVVRIPIPDERLVM